MQRIVDIAAPKGAVDFVSKAVFFILLIGLLNYGRDVFLGSDPPDTLLNNVFEAALVGMPFTVFALALVQHLHKLQRQLADLAATDMLTGLPNRRGFFEAMAAGGSIAQDGLLLLIDVDHFKKVNDTYGHAVGDLCLKAVAQRLRALAHGGEKLGRIGGEEFAVHLPRGDDQRLAEFGHGLTSGVTIRVPEVDRNLTVTMSVGAVATKKGARIDACLAAADEALYRAKRAGRARWVLASAPANEAA